MSYNIVETKTNTDMAKWQDFKQDGDTSYNEFNELHSLADDLAQKVKELTSKAQDYNVSCDTLADLDTALYGLQDFQYKMALGCNNMVKYCKENGLI